MARIFADGQEMTNKDDFDQKVNVDNSLYKTIRANDNMADILGRNPQTGQRNLVVFRDNSGPNDNNLTASQNGSGIVFGGDDTAAVLSVDGWGSRRARIGWQNSDTNRMWHEDIAWKSDIQRLEQEISDLKKQIGGVTSHLYAYLRKALATSTEFMEVA